MQELGHIDKAMNHAEHKHGQGSKEVHGVALERAMTLTAIAVLWHKEVTLITPTDVQGALELAGHWGRNKHCHSSAPISLCFPPVVTVASEGIGLHSRTRQ